MSSIIGRTMVSNRFTHSLAETHLSKRTVVIQNASCITIIPTVIQIIHFLKSQIASSVFQANISFKHITKK